MLPSLRVQDGTCTWKPANPASCCVTRSHTGFWGAITYTAAASRRNKLLIPPFMVQLTQFFVSYVFSRHIKIALVAAKHSTKAMQR